jgi:RNA polymerase sigma-70 factor (ECF subfamily)
VSAVRTALNLRRQRREEPEEKGDPVAWVLADHANPELEYVRRRYASELTTALREAFGGLSPDQRLVLRLHAVKGMTGDQIASTLQIHRATVVRWIARAREEILREATRSLRERTGVSSSELDSLIDALRSQVDLRLSQLLGSA